MERLSALMDGELDAAEVAQVLSDLRGNDEYRRQWQAYHMAGDALRATTHLHVDIGLRVMEALADEPVVLAPQRRLGMLPMQRAFALAASVAGIAVVSTLAWNARPGASLQLVSKGPSVPVEAQVPAQLAGIDLQSYLIAHQAHAPSAQGAVHYVKTVALEAGGR
ncbi:MAG TPA: sigma-E factor negative regulatory protein [Rhodocyclaceae bacterium]|jgi:sigma-E factor negative regulatory protein RseA|nr:sigma-E factor negative regulatory protein [Rhodocyclaceae bacterium]